jgi:hypothetical protein
MVLTLEKQKKKRKEEKKRGMGTDSHAPSVSREGPAPRKVSNQNVSYPLHFDCTKFKLHLLLHGK